MTVPVAGHAAPPPRRGSSLALGLLAVLLLATLAVLAHGRWGVAAGQARMAQGRTLVQALQLTDLAWFTEARYTRHLSQSDLHSAFQDAPGAMEHFPAGSLLSPPQRLRQAAPPAGFMEGPPR